MSLRDPSLRPDAAVDVSRRVTTQPLAPAVMPPPANAAPVRMQTTSDVEPEPVTIRNATRAPRAPDADALPPSSTLETAGLPAPLEHVPTASSAVAGAAGGAALGAVAGPVGMVVGGVAGAVVGAALGHVLETDQAEVEAHDRKLDDVIGVNGQGLGVAPGTPRDAAEAQAARESAAPPPARR